MAEWGLSKFLLGALDFSDFLIIFPTFPDFFLNPWWQPCWLVWDMTFEPGWSKNKNENLISFISCSILFSFSFRCIQQRRRDFWIRYFAVSLFWEVKLGMETLENRDKPWTTFSRHLKQPKAFGYIPNVAIGNVRVECSHLWSRLTELAKKSSRISFN